MKKKKINTTTFDELREKVGWETFFYDVKRRKVLRVSVWKKNKKIIFSFAMEVSPGKGLFTKMRIGTNHKDNKPVYEKLEALMELLNGIFGSE